MTSATDQAANDAAGVLEGLFGFVDKGLGVYSEFSNIRDRGTSTPVQTSVSPAKTTTDAAGNIALSPQTLTVAIAAVVAVGAVIWLSRK